MPKKIYDIRPPRVARKTENSIKEFLKDDKKKKRPSRKKKEGRPIWVPVFYVAGAVVLVVAIYLFFELPKADIQIWPKVDTLSYQQTIIADKSADLIDTTKMVIPAQYFEANKTNSQDFPATGSASNDGQASGTITVYNKFDPPTPFTFKAGTHFMSDSGKLFVALQKIVIPAAKKSGSKITPGSVQIQVQAVEAGTDYNIAPSNFSVPGLKGTADYYSIYATSTSAMSGGYTGKVKKITDDDIQGAKDVLGDKTISDATAALKAQIPADEILLGTALFSNITSASTTAKAGTVADSFTYQVTAKARALVFKKSDLEQFAKNYIISQVPEGKAILDNSFKMDYSATTIDVSGGKATINLTFSSGVYQNIDKNSLTLSLIGENENQIKETINSSLGDQISNVRVNFWPFWVFSAPNNQNKINVELKFQ